MCTGKLLTCRDADVQMFKPRVRVTNKVSNRVKVRTRVRVKLMVTLRLKSGLQYLHQHPHFTIQLSTYLHLHFTRG